MKPRRMTGLFLRKVASGYECGVYDSITNKEKKLQSSSELLFLLVWLEKQQLSRAYDNLEISGFAEKYPAAPRCSQPKLDLIPLEENRFELGGYEADDLDFLLARVEKKQRTGGIISCRVRLRKFLVPA